jgi:large repetitive protein
MKKAIRILYLLPAALLACNQPVTETTKPAIAFASFINLETNVVIPGTTDALPAKFIANVRSSDRKKVTTVQCFNGSTVTPDTAALRYVNSCVYDGVSGGSVTIKAEATNQDNLKSDVTKTVAIDSVFPKANTLRVGTNDLNPNSGTQFATTAALDSTLAFKLTSVDTDVLLTSIDRDGQTLVTSPNGSVQSELKIQNLTPFTVGLSVVDKAGNSTRYTVLVTVNKTDGDGIPPVANITSPGSTTPPTEVKETLNVAVNASDASGIQEVTLIANNNPVATTRPDNTSPTVAFSLDTLKFDNGPLELKAVATDKSGLSTTSGAITVIVKNIQAPVLQINSPGNGAEVSGFAPVSLNVRKRASAFTYASDITVRLIDYRGTTVETKIVAVNGQAGDTAAFSTLPFDLSAIPNDTYTITAAATVAVTADTVATRPISDTITIRNLNTNLQPPAAVVIHPVRANETQTVLPVFRQTRGFVVAELSDDKGITSVELRLTCDTCGANGPVNALEEYIGYVPPVLSTTAVLRYDADATPFLPDGDYTARIVTQDTEKNRNIQEVKLRIQRQSSYTTPFTAQLNFVANIVAGQLNPKEATLNLTNLDANKTYRIQYWIYDTQNKLVGVRQNTVSSTTSDGVGLGFVTEGTYTFFAQVQEVSATTPRVDSVSKTVNVVRNPSN